MLNGVNSNNFSYTLDGGAGNDHLAGGAGNDSLTGGTGNDVMEGLSGNDSFKFAANFGSDIITDFGNHTTGNNADLLDLSGLGHHCPDVYILGRDRQVRDQRHHGHRPWRRRRWWHDQTEGRQLCHHQPDRFQIGLSAGSDVRRDVRRRAADRSAG
jgi:hypothetical protein